MKKKQVFYLEFDSNYTQSNENALSNPSLAPQTNQSLICYEIGWSACLPLMQVIILQALSPGQQINFIFIFQKANIESIIGFETLHKVAKFVGLISKWCLIHPGGLRCCLTWMVERCGPNDTNMRQASKKYKDCSNQRCNCFNSKMVYSFC